MADENLTSKKTFCIIALLVFGLIPIRDLDIHSEGSKIWTVDDYDLADFCRIQDAVNAASDYDTIIVKEGIYDEDVIIDKPLTVLGEDRRSVINGHVETIIGGGGEEAKIVELTILSGIILSNRHATCQIFDNTVKGGIYIKGYPIYSISYIINNTIESKGITLGTGDVAYIYGNSFINCMEIVSSTYGYFEAENNTIKNPPVVSNGVRDRYPLIHPWGKGMQTFMEDFEIARATFQILKVF